MTQALDVMTVQQAVERMLQGHDCYDGHGWRVGYDATRGCFCMGAPGLEYHMRPETILGPWYESVEAFELVTGKRAACTLLMTLDEYAAAHTAGRI